MTKRIAAGLFRGLFDDAAWHLLKRDKPALREAWNNYTDDLAKNNRITQSQYNRWLNPFERRK